MLYGSLNAGRTELNNNECISIQWLVDTNGWSAKINLSRCQLQLLETYLYLETFQDNVIS